MERCSTALTKSSCSASFSFYPPKNLSNRHSSFTGTSTSPPQECRTPPPVSLRLNYEATSPFPDHARTALDFGGGTSRYHSNNHSQPCGNPFGRRASLCDQWASSSSNNIYHRQVLGSLPLATNIPSFSLSYSNPTRESPLMNNNAFGGGDDSFQMCRQLSPEALPLTQPCQDEDDDVATTIPTDFGATLPHGHRAGLLENRGLYESFGSGHIDDDTAHCTPRVQEQQRGCGLHFRGTNTSQLDSPAPVSGLYVGHVTFNSTPACSYTAASLQFNMNAAAVKTPQTSRVKSDTLLTIDHELNPMNLRFRTAAPQPVTMVNDRIFLGGFPGSDTRQELHRLGVSRMINCCSRQQRLTPLEATGFKVCEIAAEDRHDYFILYHHLDGFMTEMDNIMNTSNEKVFVHCMGGVNRSVALVVGYLMQRLSLTPVEAIKQFRNGGRMVILDNTGFRKEIVDHYLDHCRPDLAAEEYS